MIDVREQIQEALTSLDFNSARSQQARDGILGPSDIGFCRQKAALVTKGVQPTDNPPKWSASVGTAIHNYVEAAIKKSYPGWMVGSIDNIEVTATLPSGANITGHPDIVIPAENMVLDIKTVDGLSYVKNKGSSLSHKYQRSLYALGLVQDGTLDESKPVLVGNIYFDRSGSEPEPYVLIEELDYTLIDEIDSWVQDVIYAVTHNEDASRDVASPVCERICEFFTVCRGGLDVQEDGILITDGELLSAIETYVQAADQAREADALKRAAKKKLEGVNGSTGDYQVRWVEVQPSYIEATERAGYMRMDIRKVH
jgi:hypothetical protein